LRFYGNKEKIPLTSLPTQGVDLALFYWEFKMPES